MMTKEDFREWMKGRGYNQTQVADILRVSQSQVSRWLSGRSEIPGPVEVLLSIEKAMRRSLVDLPDGASVEEVRNARVHCSVVYEMFLLDPAIPPDY